jgi:hypothetical protein
MERIKTHRVRDELPCEGRDELNLAEFPIAALSSRPDSRCKTIHFEDCIWDKGHNTWVTRRLTISASDQYGLPTALDDEVILGLIQLTREEGFVDRQVFFSRYRLIRLLGWRNEGKSYTRLDTSLKRWLGVTLYYGNAWWDKLAQSWVDENFHVLERVSLYDRQRRLPQAGMKDPSLSLFAWNEVVFRSFQSGYLKQIDMDLYRRLHRPVAKRLYRLLDKRFYHKPHWRFDLRELGCEHVGLSRSYDIGQLKRKLRPAIAELETVGYLEPETEGGRFTRICEKHWQVSFTKGQLPKRAAPVSMADSNAGVLGKLLQRDVNPATAREIVAQFPAQRIERHIEVLDWLMHQGNRIPKNPAGYLVQSIRVGYEVPEGFPRPCSETRTEGRSRGSTASSRRSNKGGDLAAEAYVRTYLQQLDPRQRARLEERALASADLTLSAAFRRAVAEGVDVLADVYRHLIVEKYIIQYRKERRRAEGRDRDRRLNH